MALNVLQAHAKAFLDLLDADDEPPALNVIHGPVPDGTVGPYVVVYLRFRTPSGTQEPDKVSLEAASDVIYATATCHSVGANPYASLAVAGRVRTAVRGVRPVIAGRAECSRIGHVDGMATGRDESTGVGVFDTVDVWEFFSLPG